MELLTVVDFLIIVASIILIGLGIRAYYRDKYDDMMLRAYAEGMEEGVNRAFTVMEEIEKQRESLQKEKV